MISSRRDFESRKFLCDPRTGHSAIALRLSRSVASSPAAPPLGVDRTLELGHHILKAHLYRESSPASMEVPARDLQAVWVSSAAEDPSAALGAVRNVSNPNVNVSRLLLLSGNSR